MAPRFRPTHYQATYKILLSIISLTCRLQRRQHARCCALATSSALQMLRIYTTLAITKEKWIKIVAPRDLWRITGGSSLPILSMMSTFVNLQPYMWKRHARNNISYEAMLILIQQYSVKDASLCWTILVRHWNCSMSYVYFKMNRLVLCFIKWSSLEMCD